jgi:hypothetical protein
MGMPVQMIALLLMEHKRDKLTGPVLTYGVQLTNATVANALWLFQHFGIEPDPAAVADIRDPNAWLTIPQFAALLGIHEEVVTLDVSAYEGADYVVDLNYPVTPDLIDRFGLIIDGGTLEHVFDIRRCLINTVEMLRTGGRVVHLTPANNHFNHGFVQVSPTLYHDYYVANKFEEVRGFLIVYPRKDYTLLPWKLIEYQHEALGGLNSLFCADDTMLSLFYTARKAAGSTAEAIPTQSYFLRSSQEQLQNGPQYVIRYDRSNPTVELITETASLEGVNIADLVSF